MRRRFIVLFVLGLLILAGLVYWVGPLDVIREVSKLSLTYFLTFLLIQIILLFLYALKWRIVLRHSDVSFKNVFLVSLVGNLTNNITPVGGAGGEPVMAYLLAKLDNISTEKSAASVIINLFLDVFPLSALLILSIGLAFQYDIPTEVAFLLALTGVIVLAAFILSLTLILNKRVSFRIIHFIVTSATKIPFKPIRNHALDAEKRINEVIANFNDAMRKTTTDTTVMGLGVLASTLIWGLYLLRTYLIFQMIGVPMPITTLIIVRVAVVLVAFITILPGALGVWESVMAWLFGVFNTPMSAAVAATLIERFFSFWVASFIGLLATVYLGVGYVLRDANGSKKIFKG